MQLVPAAEKWSERRGVIVTLIAIRGLFEYLGSKSKA